MYIIFVYHVILTAQSESELSCYFSCNNCMQNGACGLWWLSW
jgi:hypothetical protein